MKVTKIYPLYKNGDMSSMSNYRPISLCSIFSKLLEKLMNSLVSVFSNKHKILYTYQFGFHSTTAALFEVVEMIEKELERLWVCFWT